MNSTSKLSAFPRILTITLTCLTGRDKLPRIENPSANMSLRVSSPLALRKVSIWSPKSARSTFSLTHLVLTLEALTKPHHEQLKLSRSRSDISRIYKNDFAHIYREYSSPASTGSLYNKFYIPHFSYVQRYSAVNQPDE